MLADETARTIDEEVRTIVNRNYARAQSILTKHKNKLHAMAHALIKYETIDAEQIKDIMEGREPRPPKDRVPADSGTPPSGRGAAESPDKDGSVDGKIAGPAGQH